MFCLPPDPIEDLLFTISIVGDVLSAVSGLMQSVRESRLDTGLWTVKMQAVENPGLSVGICGGRLENKMLRGVGR
jgi:hypothetical protein